MNLTYGYGHRPFHGYRHFVNSAVHDGKTWGHWCLPHAVNSALRIKINKQTTHGNIFLYFKRWAVVTGVQFMDVITIEDIQRGINLILSLCFSMSCKKTIEFKFHTNITCHIHPMTDSCLQIPGPGRVIP